MPCIEIRSGGNEKGNRRGQGAMEMVKRISLRSRIYLILTVLVFIALMGALVTVWYTYRMEGLLNGIINKNVAAYQAAEALETALVNQKGFVSYYFMDNDPEWLTQLGVYRQIFRERLNEVRALAETEEEKEIIDGIETAYLRYITGKDEVIAYYKTDRREEGALLHVRVRTDFSETLNLCEAYKDIHKNRIAEARERSRAQARNLRIIAATAMLAVILLGLLLVFLLVNQILGPVRRLALDADRRGGMARSGDEVKALDRSVRGLIEDMDHTHSELEKSREHILQTERLAMVGKLAAGVAHSVRNPLTSVKMRLFSLGRSLKLTAVQKEDFAVISEEIGHIDTIIQNFIEFARPPKLKMQKISPSEVVDVVLQLLEHRLRSYDVDIDLHREHPLPEIQADPEQLKEVLVNLIINACEAMEEGGCIRIQEEEHFVEPLGHVAVVRLADSGSGIPESIRDQVFQPFFTTKDEGSGLGLSIAARIVADHGGWLDFTSNEGMGVTFVMTLPMTESECEQHPGH
jgi:signal transduction histidine kinase